MEDLVKALRDLEEKRVYSLVEEKIAQGVPAIEIVKACNRGMVEVGELFSSAGISSAGPSSSRPRY